MGKEGPPVELRFEDRDSILYNLGLGAKHTELKYVLCVSFSFSLFQPLIHALLGTPVFTP